MRLIDMFESVRPVATIWRKRGDKIERGRVTQFIPDPQPLTQIEVVSDVQEDENEKRDCDGTTP